MSGMTLRRRGVEAKITTGGAFNPLTYISWNDAYWADSLGLSDGTSVSTWQDSGSRALDLAQATSANQPTYRTSGINGKPAVQFDGTDDYLQSAAGTTISQPFTQVVIFKALTMAATTSIAASGSGTGSRGVAFNVTPAWVLAYGSTLVGSAASTGTHLALGFASGASSTLKVDGSTVASGSAGATGINALRLSGRAAATEPFNGYVAFYGVVARALTGTEESDLRAWSQSYYGTP